MSHDPIGVIQAGVPGAVIPCSLQQLQNAYGLQQMAGVQQAQAGNVRNPYSSLADQYVDRDRVPYPDANGHAEKVSDHTPWHQRGRGLDVSDFPRLLSMRDLIKVLGFKSRGAVEHLARSDPGFPRHMLLAGKGRYARWIDTEISEYIKLQASRRPKR